MKKLLAIVLIAASLTACNDGDKSSETTTKDTTTSITTETPDTLQTITTTTVETDTTVKVKEGDERDNKMR